MCTLDRVSAALFLLAPLVSAASPRPPGRLIDLGGHRLHLYCTGRGSPLVVVETGLGDFSFDWILVQRRVEGHVRICTYDRAGYAWSDPGPLPRTYDQLNLELHDALARAGERGPFVLVGHSFGGPVARAYAYKYPHDVAGLLLVEAVSEDQYIMMGPKAAGRIRDGARGIAIPEPHETLEGAGVGVVVRGPEPAAGLAPIDPPYDRLPPAEQRLHVWAAGLAGLEAAENSQREWSSEYMARWAAAPQKGLLGRIPLVVLTRAHGGFPDGLNLPAAELERERLKAQRALADLSSAGTQQIVLAGHNLHLEAPDVVADAIQDVVERVRAHAK